MPTKSNQNCAGEKKDMKCKYCKKEGIYSFGWVDEVGTWHNKHFTCEDHFKFSLANQGTQINIHNLTFHKDWGNVVVSIGDNMPI